MDLSWYTAVQQLPPWRGAHLRLKFNSVVSHAPPSPRKLIHGKKSNMLALSCLLNCAPHGTMRSLGCFDVEIVLPRRVSSGVSIVFPPLWISLGRQVCSGTSCICRHLLHGAVVGSSMHDLGFTIPASLLWLLS